MNEAGRASVATVGELRRTIAASLAAAFSANGRDGSPELDARLLVGHVLGCGPGEVVLRDSSAVDADMERAALAMAQARMDGAPVARILGEKEFWSLPFRLSSDTLVPRPDTETLVEAALAAIDARGWRGKPLTILDLGTGSGAILAALLSELPAASGIGVDRVEGAARTARWNCDRLDLGGRARFVVGHWADSIRQRFDVVVSNPPYIAAATIDTLPVEVRDHDPHMALDGGEDGLSAYRAIVESLGSVLDADGLAFLEIGAGQAGPVSALARRSGYIADTRRDIAGIERVVSLRRNGSKIGLEIDGEPDTVRPAVEKLKSIMAVRGGALVASGCRIRSRPNESRTWIPAVLEDIHQSYGWTGLSGSFPLRKS